MKSTGFPGPDPGDGRTHHGRTEAQVMSADGCAIVMRELIGASARELFLHGRPSEQATDAASQARAIYRALAASVDQQGERAPYLVSETVFYRRLRQDLDAVRDARRLVAAESDVLSASAHITEIGQPPADDHALLEVQWHVIVPGNSSALMTTVNRPAGCACDECSRARGVALSLGGHSRFYTGALYGKGRDAHEQTLDLFGAANAMLKEAGMTFKDVVRTWLYLDEMERDYPQLNKARRAFFDELDVSPPPASTGIGAGLVPDGHHLCMSLVAMRGDRAVALTPMTTPTLNEAPQYGADFSRGMRLDLDNQKLLFVSGTASINEAGESVHAGDFDAQVDRMLLNVTTLLEAQGASFAHIVSATTYVKDRKNAGRIRKKFEQAGYTGFPNALVEGPVCRPELLCETEALAVVS